MPNPDATQPSPRPADEDYCDYCGEPSPPTGTVRDAWEQPCAEDADVMTEDLSITWTFTAPKQVQLRELSCGCWRVVEPQSAEAGGEVG